MTFNQFAAFVAAAKHLNVTRAAKALHISQPSISRQLRLLQEEYKLQLYVKKNAGGIELTADGAAFLPYASRIVAELDALKERLNRRALKDRSSPLRVAGNGVFDGMLSFLLRDFKSSHPEAEIILGAGSSFQIQQRVEQGTIDIGLVTKPSYSTGVTIEPYLAHELVFFVRVDHPLASRDRLTLAEVTGLPLIVRGDPGGRSTSQTRLEQQGWNLKIAMRCESADALRAAVRDNNGIGILYHDCIKNGLKRGEFATLNVSGFKLEARSHILRHKRRQLSDNAKEFLALLRQWKEKTQTLEAVRTTNASNLPSRRSISV
jgi:DNA-binding transcriptional LysR family regulator